LAPELLGKNSMDQEALDKLLLEIDSTFDRSNLGIHTLTAVSQAIAKLGAMESDLPLFKYIRVLHDFTGSPEPRLESVYKVPAPVVTVHRSASHDSKQRIPAQEVMVTPRNVFSYKRDLVKLFSALSRVNIHTDARDLLSFLELTYQKTSKLPFKLDLGMDMAASRYSREDSNNYIIPNLISDKTPFNNDSAKLAQVYFSLIEKYHPVFLEDLFSEDDYSGWKALMAYISENDNNIQVVSDDFTSSNMERLEKVGILECSNNIVIKPSQSGTVTESVHLAQKVRKLGQKLTISYRYGETEDTFISDLAVALNADYIRSGYYLGSEYNSKLNRLLQIEDSIK
jgi:enolase